MNNHVSGAKPRLHADLIKQWADGATIQMEFRGSWTDVSTPVWDGKYPLRIKPREFPKSSMSPEEAYAMYVLGYQNVPVSMNAMRWAMKGVADAAVKQYIIDQEAILADEQKAALLDTKHVQSS